MGCGRATHLAEKLTWIGTPQALPGFPSVSLVESFKMTQKGVEDKANHLVKDKIKWLFHTKLKSLMENDKVRDTKMMMNTVRNSIYYLLYINPNMYK